MRTLTGRQGLFLSLEIPGHNQVLMTQAEVEQLKRELGITQPEPSPVAAFQHVPTWRLDAELLRRAIARTDAAIIRAEETLRALHHKHDKQHAEWDRQTARQHPSHPSH